MILNSNIVNKLFKALVLIGFSVFITTSCIPYKKTLYLRDEGSKYQDTIPTFFSHYKIQPNDILAISINSFHAHLSDAYTMKDAKGLGGYLVKASGYLCLPMMDSLYVKDLTIPQIESLLTSKLSETINDPFVVIQLVNFKVLFLGEIHSPGPIIAKENTLTLFEAIALAGDIPETGDRTKVKLIRKFPNGSSQIIILDITNKDIMASPYFYLKPNDIIYVQPLRIKNIKTNLQTLTLFISLITIVLLISNYTRK